MNKERQSIDNSEDKTEFLGENLVPLYLPGASAKLRNATVNFVMSVCPSAWNNSAPTGPIFVKFYVTVFRKSVEKMQFSFNSEKNNWYIKTNIHLRPYLAHFFLK